MTTPRDAIGLSERLRDYRVWSRTHQRYDAVELTQEAAAALDALQARVKELEAEQAAIVRDYQRMNSQLADEMKRATRAEQERAEEWNLRREAGSQRDAAKAVSETLRQERDEAYERLKPFAEAADDIEDNVSNKTDIWEAPCAMQITVSHLRAARDLVRRLAGRVKGGNDET